MNTDIELQRTDNTLAKTAGYLWRVWDGLVKPVSSTISQEERRRARLLAAVLVAVFVAGTLILIVRGIQMPGSINDADYLGSAISLFAVLGLYVLNRHGYTDLAALALIGLMLVLFVGVAFAPNSLKTLLYFAVIPILLAALFFNARVVIWVTAITLIASVLLSQVSSGMTLMDVFDASQLILLSATVILVYINHTRAVEQIRRTELQAAYDQVRASEAALEQRVQERTHELRLAKEEAEQSNKVKSQFLAAMSHELRTPLNAILNFSQFVASGMLGGVNDEQVDILNKITSSGKHLLSLINDVLDISKIESGALTLFVEDDINLETELQAVEAAGRTLLNGKPVQLTVDVQDNLPPVVGDRRRIRQIVLNLVSNACKFTEEGHVTIQLRQQSDSEVLLTVRDTGPGIAPEDHTTIFETFRQTEAGLRHSEGTGLGLPISLRLAEAHGGQLWFESTLGQGATFHVALPIRAPHLLQMIRTAEKKEEVQ